MENSLIELGTDSSIWDESVYWSFSPDEIDTIYTQTRELYDMAIEAAVRAIDLASYARYGFDQATGEAIAQSFKQHEDGLLTRMSFIHSGGCWHLSDIEGESYHGMNEASVTQWHWLMAARPGAKQFNDIEEALGPKALKRCKQLAGNKGAFGVHGAALGGDANGAAIDYLMHLLQTGGCNTKTLALADIGLHPENGFVDLEDETIQILIKSHPWQWMIADQFGRTMLEHVIADRIEVIEPLWKMMLTNRAIMAEMWAMTPYYPGLIETHKETQANGFGYDTPAIARPLLAAGDLPGRIGEVSGGRFISNTPINPEAAEGEIVQTLLPLTYPGMKIDIWCVGDEPCGLIVSEERSDGRVYVPHLIE